MNGGAVEDYSRAPGCCAPDAAALNRDEARAGWLCLWPASPVGLCTYVVERDDVVPETGVSGRTLAGVCALSTFYRASAGESGHGRLTASGLHVGRRVTG